MSAWHRKFRIFGLLLLASAMTVGIAFGLLVLLEYAVDQDYDGPGTLTASVTVQDEPVHALPKTQYSHFIEHMGNCINGGIWAEGEEPDMLLGGVRRELLEVMRSLKPPYIQYPGGCFADVYHWQDGIGPREQRPERPNEFWGGVEDNRFGTDEFMALCEAVGALPMLTVNFGTGTPEEAAAWVEYCNGSVDSRWGAERAKNGHPEPYRVEYWFVGNETFGLHEPGNQAPEDYVVHFREFAAAMRTVDASIKVIGVGDFYPRVLAFLGKDVNRKVLQGAGVELDMLSIHQYAPYWGPVNLIRHSILNRKSDPSRKIYYDTLSSLNDMQQFLDRCIADIGQYSPPGKAIPLILDEWNLWFGLGETTQTNYNLRDALWTASVLSMLHRVAPHVPLANIAQMVNGLGIIWSDKEATFLTASGQVFKLYANHAGDELLRAELESPQLPDGSGLSALDISATRTGDRIILFLINRHYDAALEVSCALQGVAGSQRVQAWEIHHENPVQYNTPEAPHEVTIRERSDGVAVEENIGHSTLSFEMQPHSILCVELEPEAAPTTGQ